MLVIGTNALRRHTSAGNRHETQLRERTVAKADLFQEFIGIGHAGKIGAAAGRKTVEESWIKDRAAGNVKAGADSQMGVQHRKAIGVMQRQDQAAAIVGAKLQIFGNRAGIDRNIASRKPHRLAAPGTARGRQQEAEVRMQRLVTAPQIVRFANGRRSGNRHSPVRTCPSRPQCRRRAAPAWQPHVRP